LARNGEIHWSADPDAHQLGSLADVARDSVPPYRAETPSMTADSVGPRPAARRHLTSCRTGEDYPPLLIFAQLSRRVTVRLKTSAPGFESIGSEMKYAVRSN
jgi:hypothetical protein